MRRALLLAAIIGLGSFAAYGHHTDHNLGPELDLRPFPELPRYTLRQIQDAIDENNYELIDMWADERHRERVERMEDEYYDQLVPEPGDY